MPARKRGPRPNGPDAPGPRAVSAAAQSAVLAELRRLCRAGRRLLVRAALPGPRRWLIDVVLLVYTLLSIVGWLQIGLPNPRGLGYLAKALELALIMALAVHAWSGIRPGSPVQLAE